MLFVLYNSICWAIMFSIGKLILIFCLFKIVFLYFRLDWNLLSTASPAINAWMNPNNRFAIRVVHMLRCKYRRSTAIVTCLMAEALDMQGIHMPIKVIF